MVERDINNVEVLVRFRFKSKNLRTKYKGRTKKGFLMNKFNEKRFKFKLNVPKRFVISFRASYSGDFTYIAC